MPLTVNRNLNTALQDARTVLLVDRNAVSREELQQFFSETFLLIKNELL